MRNLSACTYRQHACGIAPDMNWLPGGCRLPASISVARRTGRHQGPRATTHIRMRGAPPPQSPLSGTSCIHRDFNRCGGMIPVKKNCASVREHSTSSERIECSLAGAPTPQNKQHCGRMTRNHIKRVATPHEAPTCRPHSLSQGDRATGPQGHRATGPQGHRATGHIITTPPPGSTYARLHGPRCTTSPHPHCYQCELSGEAAMTLGNWMGNDYLERLLRSGWESNLSTRAVPIQNTRSHRRKTDAGLGAAAGLVDGQAPSPEHSRRAPTNMRHSQTTSRAHSEARSIAELLVDDPAQLLPPTKPQLNNPHLDDIEAAKPAGHDGASEPKHARNDTSSEPGREEAPATPTA